MWCLEVMDDVTKLEFLTATELAGKLKVKPSWVVKLSKKSRTRDPIPLVKLGRHNRYAWGSKALTAWINRRSS